MTFGPNGNLFVSDRGNDHIVEFDGNVGTFVQIFADSAEIDFPAGLAFKPLP
jgi:hypothetical protein